MGLTEYFKEFALLGAEWVMWVLVLLSVVSIAVMIDRVFFLRARKLDFDELLKDMVGAIKSNKTAAFEDKYKDHQAMPARVALQGVIASADGIEAAGEAMTGEKARSRRGHEKFVTILGTLGNNAPFIGLFGTVLGIIGAFEDLSGADKVDAKLVHGSISEALVATAVGLLVAIPAVIAFNYFNRRIRAIVSETDETAHALLGAIQARENN